MHKLLWSFRNGELKTNLSFGLSRTHEIKDSSHNCGNGTHGDCGLIPLCSSLSFFLREIRSHSFHILLPFFELYCYRRLSILGHIVCFVCLRPWFESYCVNTMGLCTLKDYFWKMRKAKTYKKATTMNTQKERYKKIKLEIQQ